MSKASIKFYPNLGKKNKKTGQVPVYLRVINNRDKAEICLSLSVNEKDLPFWNPRLMRFEDPKLSINKLLNKYQQDFEDLIYRNSGNLADLSSKDLRDLLIGTKSAKGPWVIHYISDYYNKVVENNGTLVAGTKKNYRKAIHHFQQFLISSNRPKLTMAEVSSLVANEFKDYLLSDKREQNKKGMVESSAAGTIKKLQVIFQRAVDDDKIPKNPFSGIRLKTQARYREKLNSHEIKAIYRYDLSNFPTLEKVRDIFMFSVFTGLAYHDAMTLTKSQLQVWQGNELYIHLKRVKTEVETKQFLVLQAFQVIAKYAPSQMHSEKLLPSISNQQLNMRLKTIAEKVEINKPLTSHIARHSYRQLLAEAGLKDIASIKTMMGHSRSGDIDAVYHSVTEKQLFEAKTQLQKFLNKLFK